MKFEKFIEKDMFTHLSSCIIIVTALVELTKSSGINCLLLNFIFSMLVNVTRVILIGDYSKEALILGFYNIIPLMLGATGTYEFIKHIV